MEEYRPRKTDQHKVDAAVEAAASKKAFSLPTLHQVQGSAADPRIWRAAQLDRPSCIDFASTKHR